MIKNWSLFLESNKTRHNEEESLKECFDLESEDIKEWVQDFLDEHLDLDMEISVITRSMFFITFFEKGTGIHNVSKIITKEKYPFPNNILTFLKERLHDYGCDIVPEPGEDLSGWEGLVYYAVAKHYMSIRVVKV